MKSPHEDQQHTIIMKPAQQPAVVVHTEKCRNAESQQQVSK